MAQKVPNLAMMKWMGRISWIAGLLGVVLIIVLLVQGQRLGQLVPAVCGTVGALLGGLSLRASRLAAEKEQKLTE